MSNMVSLNYIDNYDVRDITNIFEKVFFDMNLSEIFRPRMKIVLKVDLKGNYAPDLAKTTHPSVVNGLVNVLASKGVECIIVESPNKAYTLANLDDVYLDTGMLEVANSSKCKLNRDLKTQIYRFNNGVELKNVEMLDIINQADAIINIGKLKIDDKLGYMGAIQNIFGFIPGNKKELLISSFEKVKNYNNYLLDMYEIIKRKVVLNVLDGIVALESGNTQHLLGCLAISTNMFNLDYQMMKMLGVDINTSYISLAKERELFVENPIRVIGSTKFNTENFVLNEINNETVINVPSKKLGCAKAMKRPKIECNICKGCQICTKICPTNAISMELDKNEELYAKIDYNKCIFCLKCVTGCPYKIVEVKIPRKYKKIDKLIAKQNETVDE